MSLRAVIAAAASGAWLFAAWAWMPDYPYGAMSCALMSAVFTWLMGKELEEL